MTPNEKLESRNTSFPVHVTGDETKRTVEGYALLFDTLSDALPFEEVIERGALDGVIEQSDVLALLNHNRDRGVLARCKKGAGSLSLCVDDKGLLYRFEAPNTALGDELLENLRRGEVDSSSFCFDVEKDVWEKRSDGGWKRTIQRFGHIYDVSPVYNPAYSTTSVYMRGREDAERELREAEDRKRRSDYTEYWQKMEQSLNI